MMPLTGSYQNDSKTDYESAVGSCSQEVSGSQDNSESPSWFQSKKSWIYLMIGCLCFLSVAVMLVNSVHMGKSTTSTSTDVLKSASNSYCKISCSNSCAEYQSVYGKLCCDWTLSSDGSKTCSQTINKDGACLCGNADTPSSGDASPGKIVVAPPTESPKSGPAPSPAGKQHQHRHDDDWNNDWFPPSSWLPFPPFEPIKVPDNATPCKAHCDHPCGWSQSDGVSLCCEPSRSGQCSMSQSNGKCYCS